MIQKNQNKLKNVDNNFEGNMNDMEKNYEILQQKYYSMKNKYYPLKENFDKVKKERDELNYKLTKLIEQNKKTEEENKKIIDELKIQNKQLEDQLMKTKNEAQSAEEKLSKLNPKIEGALYLGNKISEQEKKIEELSKYEEENKILKEKYENSEKAIKKTETKDDYLIKSAEEYYDVVIDINSIHSLKNEGWPIKYNKESEATYDKIVSEETIKIGVLGINNVGKSYLLSKIVNSEIPTGYSVETKGISIKYAIRDEQNDNPEAVNGICILDSAGFETPLLKEEKKLNKKEDIAQSLNPVEDAIKYDEIEDELARDKAQTERFIEQLIISLSDMIILVIGKLTRTEQRLITRVKNLSRKKEKNKIPSIIIVHNLAQYHKIIEVDKHIKEYLLKSATFKLIDRKYLGNGKFNGRNYFVEKSDDSDDLQVFHYIMAKEGTEAGNYYNNFTLELIKNQFNNFNRRRAINIPEEIITLFSELSTEILGQKMECQKLGTDKNTIKLMDKGASNKINNNFQIRNAYIDQDGNYLRNKDKMEPKYSLYFYKELNEEEGEYENYLLLRLEIPGNIVRLTARSTNPKMEKFNGIVIKGIKRKDDFQESNKEDFTTIIDNRSYDEFTYFIELNRNLELSKSSAIGETNIYEIQFDKRNKEKFFPKENLNNSVRKDISAKENKQEEIKSNQSEKNLMKIASGVYVMKFKLTERSLIA